MKLNPETPDFEPVKLPIEEATMQAVHAMRLLLVEDHSATARAEAVERCLQTAPLWVVVALASQAFDAIGHQIANERDWPE